MHRKKKKKVIKILASVSFFPFKSPASASLTYVQHWLFFLLWTNSNSDLHYASQFQPVLRHLSFQTEGMYIVFSSWFYELRASNFPLKAHTLKWRNGAKDRLISSTLRLLCTSTALMQHKKWGWAHEASVGFRWPCLHSLTGEDWCIWEGEEAGYVSPSEDGWAVALLPPRLWHIKAPAEHPGPLHTRTRQWGSVPTWPGIL